MDRPMKDYSLPVGDVIMYGVYFNKDKTPQYVYQPTPEYKHIAESQTWWTPEDNVEKIKEIAKDFDGFELHVGKPGRGTREVPEVIDDDLQERRQGNMWTVSTKGVQALIGDVMVWLEITDVFKAKATLNRRTDIPCALRADMILYNSDKDYREVFDKANDYFMFYHQNNKPMTIGHKVDEKDILKKLYDI